MMWDEKEKDFMSKLGASILVWVVVLFLAFVTFGQQFTQEEATLSQTFTDMIREKSNNKMLMGVVQMNLKRGETELWLITHGEFQHRDFFVGISVVAEIARKGGEFAKSVRVLYFKQEHDRFSLGEIGVKKCMLIADLADRGDLSDAELWDTVERSITWSRARK
jgi:hypothetical protein